MKPMLIIVAVLALSGCKASPQVRITPDGVELQVVICPDTGECFVVGIDAIPDGWGLQGDPFAAPVMPFQSE